MLSLIRKLDIFCTTGDISSCSLNKEEIESFFEALGFSNIKGVSSYKRFEYEKAFLENNLEFLYDAFDCRVLNTLYSNMECSGCLPTKLKEVEHPKIVANNLDIVSLLSKMYREFSVSFLNTETNSTMYLKDLTSRYYFMDKISQIKSELKKDKVLLSLINRITPKIKVVDGLKDSLIKDKFLYIGRNISDSDFNQLKFYALVDSITCNLSIPTSIRNFVVTNNNLLSLYSDPTLLKVIVSYSNQCGKTVKEIYNSLGFATFNLEEQIRDFGIGMLPYCDKLSVILPQCENLFFTCSKDVCKFLFSNGVLNLIEESRGTLEVNGYNLLDYIKDLGVTSDEICIVRYRRNRS